jgi:hypothetical protein
MKQALAVLPMGNHGGLEILEINDEEVVTAYNYNGKQEVAIPSKVRYDKKGDPYFMRNRMRFNINDFMKVGV